MRFAMSGARCATALLLVAAASCTKGEAAVVLDQPHALSAPTKVGTAPMFAVAPSGAHTAAWVSAPGGGTDGRLYVATMGATDRVAGAPAELRDTLGPIEAHGESPPKIAYGADGTLHAIYVVAKEVPNRRFPLSALRYVRSADGGKSWSAPVTVTDDSTFGSHNFHALHVAADGTPYVSWLDGRAGKSSVWMTHSPDGGRSWAPNRRVETGGEACPCCRTALASTKDGTLYLAWRKVFPGSVRDVVVATSHDRGQTWGAPVRVHADGWVYEGCPHAGPSLAVDAAGRLHAAWWTGKEGAAGVFYARSDDGGHSFGPRVAIDSSNFSRPAHVQLALGDSGRVAVAWDDGTRATPRVLLRVSRDEGAAFDAPVTLSEEGRAAAFPVLAVRGRQLTIAWSEKSAAAMEHERHEEPNMKDPKSRKPLHKVGEDQVLVRAGTMR